MSDLCRPPVVLEVPPLLADGGPELWVITSAERTAWAGATVLWSEDGDDYDAHPPGTVAEHAVVGSLVGPLPSGPPRHDVSVLVALEDGGTLAAMPVAAADRLQSLASFGSGDDMELVAYTGARLVGKADGANLYELHGLMRRGVADTAARAHSDGALFVRWDESAVARLRIPRRLLLWPTDVYIKLLPVNDGGERQNPADVEPLVVHLRGRFRWGQEW